LRRRSRPTVDLARGLAYERFDRGEALADVAAALEVRSAIALKYLLDYVADRGLTSPEPWVDDSRFRRVAQVASETGIARPMRIVKGLGGDIEYDDVQIAIACLKNAD
jgi:hypothetical protein